LQSRNGPGNRKTEKKQLKIDEKFTGFLFVEWNNYLQCTHEKAHFRKNGLTNYEKNRTRF